MNSSLIGKIEKARRYSEERDQRVSFDEFAVQIRGDNGEHTVRLNDGRFQCDCHFFSGWGTCSHVMTMERVLQGMVSEAAFSQP